jgi:SPP1 gp7 family putative phage head morphogenesis protein
MADTFNEELLDAMIRHQIGLLRFSGHLRNRIWRILDATEADMRREIADRLRRGLPGELTPANLRRMERVLKGLRETRIKAWSEVTDLWRTELRAFALAEPGFVAGIAGTVFPVELGMVLPDPAVLRAIVTAQPFHGKTLSEWAESVQRADLDRIVSQVRIGMVQGEHPRQIARRVVGTLKLKGRDGVTEVTRRQAETITRTMVNGVGAQARRELALANQEMGGRQLFVATLDSRTTPICRALDGKTWEVDDPTIPILPLHFGERSLLVMVFDDEVIGDRPVREFTQQGLVREYAEANGLGPVKGSKRANLPLGHKGSFDAWARQRMRELTGTVPAKTTYGQFLRRQSRKFQEDVLGVTKARLFREGGLSLDRFVDAAGNELPLSDLARFEADAFRAAGLDPADFLSTAA